MFRVLRCLENCAIDSRICEVRGLKMFDSLIQTFCCLDARTVIAVFVIGSG